MKPREVLFAKKMGVPDTIKERATLFLAERVHAMHARMHQGGRTTHQLRGHSFIMGVIFLCAFILVLVDVTASDTLQAFMTTTSFYTILSRSVIIINVKRLIEYRPIPLIHRRSFLALQAACAYAVMPYIALKFAQQHVGPVGDAVSDNVDEDCAPIQNFFRHKKLVVVINMTANGAVAAIVFLLRQDTLASSIGGLIATLVTTLTLGIGGQVEASGSPGCYLHFSEAFIVGALGGLMLFVVSLTALLPRMLGNDHVALAYIGIWALIPIAFVGNVVLAGTSSFLDPSDLATLRKGKRGLHLMISLALDIGLIVYVVFLYNRRTILANGTLERGTWKRKVERRSAIQTSLILGFGLIVLDVMNGALTLSLLEGDVPQWMAVSPDTKTIPILIVTGICGVASVPLVLLAISSRPRWQRCSRFARARRALNTFPVGVPRSILNPRFHDCFCFQCEAVRGETPTGLAQTVLRVFGRGGPLERVERPTAPGYHRFAVRVPPSPHHDIFKDWKKCYHGTRETTLGKILEHGQLLMPGDVTIDGTPLVVREGHLEDGGVGDQRWIFTSPSVHYAGLPHYASPFFGSDLRRYKVVLECRQFPSSITKQTQTVYPRDGSVYVPARRPFCAAAALADPVERPDPCRPSIRSCQTRRSSG